MPRTYLDVPHRERYLDLGDYQLYCRSFGSGDTHLVGLHGGPGGVGVALAPLVAHARGEYTVHLYDQYGSGQSDGPAPGDFDRYTVAHFREELEGVRRALEADALVLYGHSWGGMLALEYVLAHPERVSRLVLSGTLHDVADAIEVMRAARREELGDAELETVRELEAERAFDDQEYRDLTQKVYDERLMRVEKSPFHERAEVNMDAYGLMWGPSEFALAGTARLRGWSVTDRLGEVDTPTLVLVGEHDEIGPEISRDLADRMPEAQLEVIEGAAHYSCWDTPEVHRELVGDFLAS